MFFVPDYSVCCEIALRISQLKTFMIWEFLFICLRIFMYIFYMSCNLYTVKFASLKCIQVRGFSIFTSVTITTLYFQDIFIIPKRNFLHLSTVTIPPSPTPGRPWIYFLSLWVGLFWTFNIIGTIQYMAFCLLLSFSVTFSSFIHFVAWINTSFLFVVE